MAEYFESRDDAVNFIQEWHVKDGTKPWYFAKIRNHGREKWLVVYNRSEQPHGSPNINILEDQSNQIGRLIGDVTLSSGASHSSDALPIEAEPAAARIDGWLLPIAAGLFLAPLGDLVHAMQVSEGVDLMDARAWSAVLLLIILVCADVFVLAKFLARHHSTRLLVVAVLVFRLSVVFTLVVISPVREDANALSALLGAVIWIPYFLTSRRVRRTFTHGSNTAVLFAPAIPGQEANTPNPSLVRERRGTAQIPYLQAYLVLAFLIYGGAAALDVVAIGVVTSGGEIKATADIEAFLMLIGWTIATLYKLVSLWGVARLRKWGAVGSLAASSVMFLGGMIWEMTLQIATGESNMATNLLFALDVVVFSVIVARPQWTKFT